VYETLLGRRGAGGGRRGRWKNIGRGESGDVKERLYDNPLVVTAILTFVLVGAFTEMITEICSKAHFKKNEQ
jgi:hypothetical protein